MPFLSTPENFHNLVLLEYGKDHYSFALDELQAFSARHNMSNSSATNIFCCQRLNHSAGLIWCDRE